MAYNLRFVVKREGVVKVIGSHVNFRSIILKTMLDRYIVTTGHYYEMIYSLSKGINCDDLGCTGCANKKQSLRKNSLSQVL